MGMVMYLKSATDSEIENFKKDPASLKNFLNDEDDTDHDQIDLDKAWHGIHYLLTGKTDGGVEPNCFLMNAPTIGIEDAGYGPPKVLTSAKLAEFEEAVTKIDEAELHNRFNADAMTEENIYPVIWDEGEDAFDYLKSNYKFLREFLTSAKDRKDGVIIWLS